MVISLFFNHPHHTLHSDTYLYSPYMAVPPGGSTFISQLLYDPEYWFSIEPETSRSNVFIPESAESK